MGMSQKNKGRRKVGKGKINFRRKKNNDDDNLPDNKTKFLMKITKTNGHCRFAGTRYYDGEELRSVELASYLKGGFRKNRVKIGDDVLIQDEGYSKSTVKDPKAGEEANFKIIYKYDAGDKKRLKAVRAYDSYVATECTTEDKGFMFENEVDNKKK